MPNDLNMTAALDRALAWDRGDSRRYLRVRIDCPQPLLRPERSPMNLVLAIDVSGSMAGEKIAAARRAAIGALDVLRPDDRLTIVSFAGEAVTHIAAQAMDDAGRARARQEVEKLQTRGNTDLSGGWFQGVIAATDGSVQKDMATRVILLSDGHANTGITDPAELAQHADQLLARGVSTSALGIGDGYDERLLGAITEAGGGRLLDAEMSEEIETVLLAEIDAAASTAADALILTLDLPAQVMAEALGRTRARRRIDGLEIPVGAMLAGHQRDVFIGLTLPAGSAGDSVPLRLRLTGRDTATGEQIAPLTAETTIAFADAHENTPQPRDVDVSQGAARAWMAQMMRRMAELNAEGDLAAGRDYLEHQARYFHRYVEALPGADDLLEELAILRANANRQWSSRVRKEVNYAVHRSVNAYSDFRGSGKRGWSERLNDG